jgi:hypothetical protein
MSVAWIAGKAAADVVAEVGVMGAVVATRLFPDDQMERLKSFPDIGADEWIRFVDPGRRRDPAPLVVRKDS